MAHLDYLMDMAIYIVTHAEKRDPLTLGAHIARKLRWHSIDTESLLTGIYAAKHFGVDDDLKEQAEQIIPKTPVYKTLTEVLQEC